MKFEQFKRWWFLISTLNELISKITINRLEIINVSNAKNNLIDVIKNKANFNQLPFPKSFYLIGSYKRGTKITPLDDIDIFYVLGIASRKNDYWHSISRCSFNFNYDYQDENNNISSVKILNLIRKEIYETYSTSQVRRNQEVVNVYLSSYKMGFDIVPVWEIENENYYLMPIGGGYSKWKRTNPFKDEEIINILNKKHNDFLKSIIKIIKYWFRKKRIKSPRSYHLEAIIYYIFFDLLPIFSYAQGLNEFYKNLINKKNLLIECPDPTGLSGFLSSGLIEEDINNIYTESLIALSILQKGEEEFVKYVEPNI